MKFKPLYVVMLAGWVLAFMLWTHTTIPADQIIVDFPSRPQTADSYEIIPDETLKLHATINYQGEFSTLVRIVPNACIKKLRVNNNPINQFPKKLPCTWHVVTHDVGQFLQPGVNQIEMVVKMPPKKWYGWSVRSPHNTPTMLAILFLVLIAPAVDFWLRKGWSLGKAARWCGGHRKHVLVTLILLPLAVFLRYLMIDDYSNDYKVFIKLWFDNIQYFDTFKVLAYPFTNYAPFYTYLLVLGDFIFPDVKIIYIVKSVSLVGDVLGAFWIYRIVSLSTLDKPDSLKPLLSSFVLLLAPTVLANASSVAQCDMWWVSFLLAAFYCLMVGRTSAMLVYGGLAFSFKFQAIFMAPFLLVCLLKKMVPWEKLWIPLATYTALCIPAWIAGRKLWGLLTIYWRQFYTYHNLTETGNLYHFIVRLNYDALRDICLMFAAITTVSFVYLSWKRWRTPTLLTALLLITFFSGWLPFVLPKMINRYFLAADVFSLVLACIRPRWFLLPLLFQCASLLTYQGWQFGEVEQITGLFMKERFDAGTWINMAAVTYCAFLCWNHIWREKPKPLSIYKTID